MLISEPHRLPATTLARLVASGELTAEAVVRSCLDRIHERDPEVRAWVHLDPEQALAAARACDRNGKGGLLKGVPFGVKDIFDTADMPSGYGSPIYTGCRPSFDASAVSLPRAAGAILLASENAVKVANEAIQALGGAGYTKDWPVERYYRDAKLLDIGAGTNEIRRMLIGRELIGV